MSVLVPIKLRRPSFVQFIRIHTVPQQFLWPIFYNFFQFLTSPNKSRNNVTSKQWDCLLLQTYWLSSWFLLHIAGHFNGYSEKMYLYHFFFFLLILDQISVKPYIKTCSTIAFNFPTYINNLTDPVSRSGLLLDPDTEIWDRIQIPD